jgi:hypothetical protein
MTDERPSGWTVTVEGLPGLPLSAEILEIFAAALDGQPEGHGASGSANTQIGILSATMTFDAASVEAAAAAAFTTYLTARLACRLPPGIDERFDIAIVAADAAQAGETKRYVARVDLAAEPAAA